MQSSVLWDVEDDSVLVFSDGVANCVLVFG